MQLHLKDYLTLANAGCGFVALLALIPFGYVTSAAFVLLAVLFDVLDGHVARKHSAVNDFGVELDSLADLVSFVIAPAFVACLWYSLDLFVAAGALFYVFAGVLRLARFNLQKDKRVYFGLPTPFAAILVMAFAWTAYPIALFLLFFAGVLMLSSARMKKPF